MKLLEEFQNIFTDEELDYLFDYDLYDSIVNAEPYTLPKELSKQKKKNIHNSIKSILNPKAPAAVLASSRGLLWLLCLVGLAGVVRINAHLRIFQEFVYCVRKIINRAGVILVTGFKNAHPFPEIIRRAALAHKESDFFAISGDDFLNLQLIILEIKK